MQTQEIARKISATPGAGRRRLVALVGPPASGKSTLAEALADAIPASCCVSMDGFHLDNAILSARGLLERKGAPDTFDVRGLIHLIARLRDEDEIVFPSFDRTLEKAIAGTGVVGPKIETIIVEGNYLLLDRPDWRDLHRFWDMSIHLAVPLDVLRTRLARRWLDLGFTAEQASAKIESNDIPNAKLVTSGSVAPTHLIT